MKRIWGLLFCLSALYVCRLRVFAEAADTVVPRLDDPLGGRVGLVTVAFAVSAAIVIVIGAVSILRRK